MTQLWLFDGLQMKHTKILSLLKYGAEDKKLPYKDVCKPII
jgi:ribosomal protein S15P/S13E